MSSSTPSSAITSLIKPRSTCLPWTPPSGEYMATCADPYVCEPMGLGSSTGSHFLGFPPQGPSELPNLWTLVGDAGEPRRQDSAGMPVGLGAPGQGRSQHRRDGQVQAAVADAHAPGPQPADAIAGS